MDTDTIDNDTTITVGPPPVTTTQPRNKRGRPSYLLIGWHENTMGGPANAQWVTDSPAGKILAAVRAGNYLAAAAQYAGVSRAAVFNWLAIAREHRPDGPYDRTDIPVDQRPYVDFLDALTQSEGQFEVELVTLALRGAREDHRFALTLLGRRFPHWREQKNIGVGAIDDEAVDPLEAIKDSPVAIAQLAALSHTLEDSAGVEYQLDDDVGFDSTDEDSGDAQGFDVLTDAAAAATIEHHEALALIVVDALGDG